MNLLTSGLIAEKQRTVEFCKMTLKSHSSRLDAIDGSVSELEGSLTNLSETVMAVNKSCYQCSAHASVEGTDARPGSSWTGWLNSRTTKSWGAAHTKNPCERGTPKKIQVRIFGTTNAILSTDNELFVGPKLGLVCYNSLQVVKRCRDYRIRFEDSKISRWFNEDNPGGRGDNEMRSIAAPAWKDGQFLAWNISADLFGRVDRTFQVGPRYGLLCHNRIQRPKGTKCRDYEVRYYCPPNEVR
ncbi:uncharacterized protein LOC135466016 isoform X2 [Liolophura sinensis]|uniref:uncharacterized protein LOC135466016 isoform X2 n=1 Tax=Liolophura sinensis TaxID=3198878 RepID=UPI0031582233